MVIDEDYVSFKTAKLLKEKGFDVPCNCYGAYNGVSLTYKLCITDKYTNWNKHTDKFIISCPTLQLAMKWLREVHNYDISICLDSYVEPYDNEYYIVIRRRKDSFEEISPCEQVYFKTYEEACEAAIDYCLNNLI